MKPETKEINKIKMALFKMGHGSKVKAAKEAGITKQGLTYVLNGGTIKQDKYDRLKAYLGLN